ncbi:MAG: Na+/H+ antiporter NhaC family protein, partial [Pseudomonadota bacterium]
FDRLKLSRARLAYIIDSTCSPICVLILLNGWGAYLLGLMVANGVDSPVSVLFQTVALNFYALLTVAGVFVTIALNRTFGPLATSDAHWTDPAGPAALLPANDLDEIPGRAIYMGIPLLVLVGGALAFMFWTGNGDITQGSGSQSILWAVVLATATAFLFLAFTQREKGELVNIGFRGMADLLPAVTVIFLALVLGDSLRALGTGAYIAGIAATIPAPWTIPAILFIAAGVTSFSTGTSWGTYGILVPIAVPLAMGAGVPLPLAIAAVIGGGVFGDHCSPISDTTIIASLAAGCDHIEHVQTQLPYALSAGFVTTVLYLAAGFLV